MAMRLIEVPVRRLLKLTKTYVGYESDEFNDSSSVEIDEDDLKINNNVNLRKLERDLYQLKF